MNISVRYKENGAVHSLTVYNVQEVLINHDKEKMYILRDCGMISIYLKDLLGFKFEVGEHRKVKKWYLNVRKGEKKR